jgi:hypothetical protein
VYRYVLCFVDDEILCVGEDVVSGVMRFRSTVVSICSKVPSTGSGFRYYVLYRYRWTGMVAVRYW